MSSNINIFWNVVFELAAVWILWSAFTTGEIGLRGAGRLNRNRDPVGFWFTVCVGLMIFVTITFLLIREIWGRLIA